MRLRTVLAVDPERIEEFRQLMAEAAADSLAEVANPDSGTLGYSAHLNPSTGGVVLHEHHDSYAALVAHLSTGPERRARLRSLCTPAGPVEIHGAAPPELLHALAALGLDIQVLPEQLGVAGLL